MGICLNPTKDGFIESISSQIYVDKSGMRLAEPARPADAHILLFGFSILLPLSSWRSLQWEYT